MQLNQRGGSMGIPEELLNAQQKHKEKTSLKNKKVVEVDPFENEGDEDTSPDQSKLSASDKPDDSEYKEVGVKDILTKLGIDFNEEDMQAMIYKGFIEKEIVVIKGHLKAVMKTLTEQEYRAVDTILTEETKVSAMSMAGYNARKSVLTLCFGLIELNGKQIVNKKPVGDDGQIDIEKLASMRGEVLAKMSGAVVDRLIETHGALTVAVNMIVRDPESLLKNS